MCLPFFRQRVEIGRRLFELPPFVVFLVCVCGCETRCYIAATFAGLARAHKGHASPPIHRQTVRGRWRGRRARRLYVIRPPAKSSESPPGCAWFPAWSAAVPARRAAGDPARRTSVAAFVKTQNWIVAAFVKTQAGLRIHIRSYGATEPRSCARPTRISKLESRISKHKPPV